MYVTALNAHTCLEQPRKIMHYNGIEIDFADLMGAFGCALSKGKEILFFQKFLKKIVFLVLFVCTCLKKVKVENNQFIYLFL